MDKKELVDLLSNSIFQNYGNKRSHKISLNKAKEEFGKEITIEEIAKKYLNDIAADYDKEFFIQYADNCKSTFKNILKNVKIEETVAGNIDRLKDASEKKSVIILPNHVSNIDSLITGYLFNENNMDMPMLVAGENLFLGESKDILPKVNACCFNRNKLKEKDMIYFHVTKEYLKKMVELNSDILVFLEGGRPYDGSIKKEQTGLFGLLLPPALESDLPIQLLTYSYSLVPEDKDLHLYNTINEKMPDTSLIGDFRRFDKEFKKSKGSEIYITVHEPKTANEYAKEAKEFSNDGSFFRKKEKNYIPNYLMHKIGSQVKIFGNNLVAQSIVDTIHNNQDISKENLEYHLGKLRDSYIDTANLEVSLKELEPRKILKNGLSFYEGRKILDKDLNILQPDLILQYANRIKHLKNDP